MKVAWTLPPGGAVHVWTVCLRRVLAENTLHEMASMLSAEEASRATSMSCPTVRSRFLAGRSTLRSILAKYVPDGQPSTLQIAAQRSEKPHVLQAGGAGGARPKFSVSHTGDVYLAAVSCGAGEVGIDVEPVDRKLANIGRLCQRWMHPDEWRQVGGDRERFLRAWTRKEAYVKALGTGIATGRMREFKVDPMRKIVDPANEGEWTLLDFELDHGMRSNTVEVRAAGYSHPAFVGSVVIEGVNRKVDKWLTY